MDHVASEQLLHDECVVGREGVPLGTVDLGLDGAKWRVGDPTGEQPVTIL